jgi:Helix-turn-helix domain
VAGDAALGAVLRELRNRRRLTLAAVARRANCTVSLLSQVENGKRQLHPWLAEQLDAIYQTGTMVVTLRGGTGLCDHHQRPVRGGVASDDVLVVQLPGGECVMPLSRRELLASLGIGAVSGTLLGRLEHAVASLQAETNDPLAVFEDAFEGFQTAESLLVPVEPLRDAMTAHVSVLDALRRAAPDEARARYAVMQARYAESLSFLSFEAGDMSGALYWTDRAAQWAESAQWSQMVTYTFVRRSTMARSVSGDSIHSVGDAQRVVDMPGAPKRISGLAAIQVAMGYASVGKPDETSRALELAMSSVATPARDEEALLGQRSLVNDNLYTIYRATCDVYLGKGESVVPVLEPMFGALSPRTTVITRAKLARAYANAGAPAEACEQVMLTLDDMTAATSQHAVSELRRAGSMLGRWGKRSDVREVAERLRTATVG